MARNHYDFTNQRAIVTGGAQGIGRAIVDRLLAGSAKVAIWDMDASLAETVASEYSELSRQIRVFVAYFLVTLIFYTFIFHTGNLKLWLVNLFYLIGIIVYSSIYM